MSVKSFVAGAVTIALPVALVGGVLHFTHEWPTYVVHPPAIVRPIVLVKHCAKPAPAPVKHHWLGAIDDGAP